MRFIPILKYSFIFQKKYEKNDLNPRVKFLRAVHFFGQKSQKINLVTDLILFKKVKRTSLILAHSAQSTEFYFLISHFNLKSKSEKLCKKHFYTFKF